MNRVLRRMALLLLASAIAAPALAQPYPSKPIRIILGYPPGSAQEGVARLVTNEMMPKLGQTIVFEIRAGANGSIAGKYVSASPPDGYTLFLGNTIVFHPALMTNNAVDASKELVPVSQLSTAPYGLLASTRVPATNFSELLAFAKKQSQPLRHGNAVPTNDLTMHMIRAQSGLVAEPIPYKSTAQVIAAVLGGEVDLVVAVAQAYLANVQAGKVRGLFVMANKRLSSLPDVPTAAEVGLKGFELASNIGVWAPPGTPKDVIQKLNSEAAAALKVPSVVERMQKAYGAEPVGSTPEEQLRAQQNEVRFWTEAAKIANFKPE